ncbi:MAG TPA: hypothetical protein VEV45_20955 [Streptosporangiaceae bacterium]|nr:hypothetical protein [Streptosporangiaceae bacterium]
MPTFDAGAVVESLDWDFTGKQPNGHIAPGWPKALAGAKGAIPEPSDAAIGRFLDDLKKLYEAAQKEGLAGEDIDTASPAEMLDALSSITGDKFVAFMADTAGIFSALCSEQPSKEQLLLLPMRMRVKFFTWVQNEVVNPEAGTGAGNGVVKSLPSARAG